MKSLLFLSLVSASLAISLTYPLNYTTVVSGSIINSFLPAQPSSISYSGYIPSLYAFDTPVNSLAVQITLSQPSGSPCSYGVNLAVSNYGFPCIYSPYGYDNDFCGYSYGNTRVISGSSITSSPQMATLSAHNNYYSGSYSYLQYSFNPGTRMFFSLYRYDDSDSGNNCSFTLNVTSINGCGNGTLGFGESSSSSSDTATDIAADVPCLALNDLGVVNSTTNSIQFNSGAQNASYTFKVTLPQNVAYVNVSLRSIGSDYVYLYGGPSPSNYVSYSTASLTLPTGSGGYYQNTTGSAFYSDISPRAGAYYITVFKDSIYSYNFSLSLSVTVCPSGLSGANCQNAIAPFNTAALFSPQGQQIAVPNGGAVYAYVDVTSAIALNSFNLSATYSTVSGSSSSARVSVRKDQIPLPTDNSYVTIYTTSYSTTNFVSFSPLDFLGNSGRFFVGFFCNPSGSSGGSNCTFNVTALFTGTGSNTNLPNTTSSGNTTAGVSTSTSTSTAGSTSSTSASTSTSTARVTSTAGSTASTSASTSTSTARVTSTAGSTAPSTSALTTAARVTGSASSVVPSMIALIAIIALMF